MPRGLNDWKTWRVNAVLVGAVLLPLPSACRCDIGWTTGPDMSRGVSSFGGSVVDGRVYVVYGVESKCQPTKMCATIYVEMFDPSTNLWSLRTGAQPGRTGSGVAGVGGVIYAMGGYTTDPINPIVTHPTALMDAYDPTTDSWSPRAALPNADYIVQATAVAGRVYVIKSGATYEYDPQLNSWTSAPPMPTARGGTCATAAGAKIYVCGGYSSDYLATVECYDPATRTWSRKRDMPSSRSGAAAAAVGGHVFVLGGANRTATRLATVEEYDPQVNRWYSVHSMPTYRWGLVAVGIGDNIYAVGGTSGASVLATLEIGKVQLTPPTQGDLVLTSCMRREIKIAPNVVEAENLSIWLATCEGTASDEVKLDVYDGQGLKITSEALTVRLDELGQGRIDYRGPPGASLAPGMYWVVAHGGGFTGQRKPFMVVGKRK